MKKQTNIAELVIVLSCVFLMNIACTKEKTPVINGGVNPVPPSFPFLNASLSKDTAWFRGNDTCTFFSDGVVKYNGNIQISPIIFTDITAPVSIQLTATKTVNGVVSPTTTKNLTIQVYSENKTNICRDAIWTRGVTQRSNTLFSINEVPTSYTNTVTAQDNWIFEFLTNNTYRLTIPGLGTYYPKYYNFDSNDSKLVIENVLLDIESSSPTEFVLTKVQPVMDLSTGMPIVPNQWVKYKIFHKK